MKSRECMYCDLVFDCKIDKPGREGCLQFKPYSEDAERRHREWLDEIRAKEQKNDIT